LSDGELSKDSGQSFKLVFLTEIIFWGEGLDSVVHRLLSSKYLNTENFETVCGTILDVIFSTRLEKLDDFHAPHQLKWYPDMQHIRFCDKISLAVLLHLLYGMTIEMLGVDQVFAKYLAFYSWLKGMQKRREAEKKTNAAISIDKDGVAYLQIVNYPPQKR
jgi:hypothetical protein